MKVKKSSELMNYAGTFGALVILCIVLSVASPNFFKLSNLMTILKQAPFYAMLASGMLFCLITALTCPWAPTPPSAPAFAVCW